MVAIGALWGCTNAFLRQEEKEEKKQEEKGERSVWAHLWALVRNPRFMVPFLINQSGSVLFVVLLGSSELSLAVPVCNATTFVFTLVTASLRGEKVQGDPVLLFVGVVFVLFGVTLMSTSK